LLDIEMLARAMAETRLSGPDVWLASILKWPAFLVVYTYTLSAARRLKHDLGGAGKSLVVKLFVKATWSLYAVFFLAEAAKTVVLLCRTTQMYLLPRTPLEVTVILVLLSASYLARHGLGPLVRYVELTTPLIVLTFMTIMVAAFRLADPANLLPVLAGGLKPVFASTALILARCAGLELPILLIPFLETPDVMYQTSALVITARMLVRLTTNTLVVAVLGSREVLREVWPLITVVKSLDIPLVGLERVDTFFTGIWVLASYSVVAVRIFFFSMATRLVLDLKSHKVLVWGTSALVYLLALVPSNPYEFDKFILWYAFFSGFVLILLPLIIYIVGILKGKQGLTRGA
jgi:spore germination protein